MSGRALETVPEIDVLISQPYTNNLPTTHSDSCLQNLSGHFDWERDYWSAQMDESIEHEERKGRLAMRLVEMSKRVKELELQQKETVKTRDGERKYIISKLMLLEGRLLKEKRHTEELMKSKDVEIRHLEEKCERLREENRHLLLTDDCGDSAIGSLGDLSTSGGTTPGTNHLKQQRRSTDPDRRSIEGALEAKNNKCKRTHTTPGRYSNQTTKNHSRGQSQDGDFDTKERCTQGCQRSNHKDSAEIKVIGQKIVPTEPKSHKASPVKITSNPYDANNNSSPNIPPTATSSLRVRRNPNLNGADESFQIDTIKDVHLTMNEQLTGADSNQNKLTKSIFDTEDTSEKEFDTFSNDKPDKSQRSHWKSNEMTGQLNGAQHDRWCEHRNTAAAKKIDRPSDLNIHSQHLWQTLDSTKALCPPKLMLTSPNQNEMLLGSSTPQTPFDHQLSQTPSECNQSSPDEPSSPIRLAVDSGRACASFKGHGSLPRNRSWSRSGKPSLFLRSYSTPNALNVNEDNCETEKDSTNKTVDDIQSHLYELSQPAAELMLKSSVEEDNNSLKGMWKFEGKEITAGKPWLSTNGRESSDELLNDVVRFFPPDPPAKEPPTKEPPTKEPPTKEPPTKEPPTKEPPTKEPPTKEPKLEAIYF